jgi:arylsulfatase A-like enzyme
MPLQAVRFGKWKAVKNGAYSAIELYDLNTDPGERNDLAKAHPAETARAAALMRSERTPDPNWRL